DAATLHLDGFDVRRQDREDPLHAFAEGDLADGEVLLNPAAGAGDAHALEGLDAFALAFLDAHVDAQGVAGLELGDRALGQQPVGLFLLQGLEDVHVSVSLGLTALYLLIGEPGRPEIRASFPRRSFPPLL